MKKVISLLAICAVMCPALRHVEITMKAFYPPQNRVQ